jgi:hypothetical protein
MKYLELIYDGKRFIGKVDSTGYSLLFVSTLLKTREERKFGFELRGADLVNKNKYSWLKLENVPSGTRFLLKVLEKKMENQFTENTIGLEEFDKMNTLTENSLLRANDSKDALNSIDEPRNELNIMQVRYKDQWYKANFNSKAYHVRFMISIKVLNEEEQLFLSLSGDDMENNSSQKWLWQEFNAEEEVIVEFL